MSQLLSEKPLTPANRLLSLDFFRGATMFLLVAEATGLYTALLKEPVAGSFLEHFFIQFRHHPWDGLRFWDLVQPFFMFIVGVAMPFSFIKRRKQGQTEQKITRHILKRCLLLLIFGVGLHCVYKRQLVWELWNVLTQLSVTILIAYFLMRYKPSTQIVVSFILLLATELAYRLFPIEGFDQPFTKDQNFGTWMDLIFMGKINPGGGWVTINFIPTAAHTIWGVVAGQTLLSKKTGATKIKQLAIGGLILMATGYLLHYTEITPIIKRIATSSFVLASGGWALVVLALCYWFIDIKKYDRWIFPFIVVGINPIFIYLFSQTVGSQWLNPTTAIFTKGILEWFNAPEFISGLITALTILTLEWLLCLYLYRKKIFFKI